MRRHHASNGERCFEMLGRTKVGFAPTGRIPSFEGWHRDLFCGSVAGRLKTPSLLIRRKNIAVRIYHKWYGSTVRRCAASLDCIQRRECLFFERDGFVRRDAYWPRPSALVRGMPESIPISL